MKLVDIQNAAELAKKYEMAQDELAKFLALRSQFMAMWIGVKCSGQRDEPLTYSVPEGMQGAILNRVESALTIKVDALKSKLLELGVVLL